MYANFAACMHAHAHVHVHAWYVICTLLHDGIHACVCMRTCMNICLCELL